MGLHGLHGREHRFANSEGAQSLGATPDKRQAWSNRNAGVG